MVGKKSRRTLSWGCAFALGIVGSLLLLNFTNISHTILVSSQNCVKSVGVSSQRAPDPARETCEALWDAKWEQHVSYLNHLKHAEDSRASTMHEWNHMLAYDMYEPEWVCEADVRVGPSDINLGDGPKFVCAPDTLQNAQDCLVYSIGSNYDFQFEEGLRKHGPNCEFHTFDGTLNLAEEALPPGLEDKNIHFHHWNLASKSGLTEEGWTRKSIGDVLKKLGHIKRRIDVFKIDCEGCEYEVLPELANYIKSGKIQVDQIQVEMHGTDAASVQRVFQSLRSADFAVFHKESNHWGCDGYLCVEFSLISKAKAREVFEQERCIGGTLPVDETSSQGDAWWMAPYQESLGKGPIQIEHFPYSIGTDNNSIGLTQLLCYAGGWQKKSAFVDIGLPTESLYFAKKGHTSDAFEARKDGYDSVKKMIDGSKLQDRINLHNMALSNFSGTIKIYEARDSSSILKSAVDVGPELDKRKEEGLRETMVKVAPLDEFVTRADAMKIDTQGAEPEIFMGAQKVLNSGLPFPILMEYCSRLRGFDELSVGVHILRGLGYTCYSAEATFTLRQDTEFCGDFYCAKAITQATCQE